VDQHGVVVDALVQNLPDTRAAKRLMLKLLKKHGCALRVDHRRAQKAMRQGTRIWGSAAHTASTRG
jgi:transposase-like protein